MAFLHTAGFKIGMLLWLMICRLSYCGARNIPSVDEYLEMKKYVEFINRPGSKSITDESGQVFDCVDINKQPALDHPLLKNHTIQIEPPSLPSEMNNGPPFYNSAMKTGLPDGGCPPGTVPIRRIRLEDVIKAGSLSNFLKGGKPPLGIDFEYHEYATARVSGERYYGMSVGFNVWNPQVWSQNGQTFSLSQLWIASGPYRDVNTIEVGWQVYPTLYRDASTRLFTFWTPDSYNTGCYNLRCSGFVQTHKSIVPEMSLPTSVSDGKMVEITLNVIKDSTDGNWWLSYKEGSNNGQWVGYWPQSLFTYLKQSADRIDWGGEVAGIIVGYTYPQMGSGKFPASGYGKSAYLRNVQYVDSSYRYVNVPDRLTMSETKKSCYKIEDKGNGASFGRHFYFGGPGGYECNALVDEPEEMAGETLKNLVLDV